MSTALTGVVGEREQEKSSVGSVEDLVISADQVSCGARCGSQVLSWGEISGDTAELPRCNCRWIFIYSGSWDKQGLLGSAVECQAAPQGTN